MERQSFATGRRFRKAYIQTVPQYRRLNVTSYGKNYRFCCLDFHVFWRCAVKLWKGSPHSLSLHWWEFGEMHLGRRRDWRLDGQSPLGPIPFHMPSDGSHPNPDPLSFHQHHHFHQHQHALQFWVWRSVFPNKDTTAYQRDWLKMGTTHATSHLCSSFKEKTTSPS